MLLAFLGVLAMQLANPAPSTGTLVVTVLERGTDAPLANASVWIIGAGAEGRSVRTGPNGTVTVEDLPAGRYTVQVSSDTHLSFEPDRSGGSSLGADRPELPVHLQAPGLATLSIPPNGIRRVTFRLNPGSEIAGRVAIKGRPVSGASVTLFTLTAQMVLRRPVVGVAENVTTDAHGHFSFQGLDPGTYLVSAQPDPDRFEAFNSVYHPGTTDVREATRIVVGEGTRDELLFDIERIPTVRIAGRVRDESSSGPTELILRELSQDTGDAVNNLLVPLDREGRFDLGRRRAGMYGLLYTRTASPGGKLLAVAARVIYLGVEPQVDIDLRPVHVSSMSGTVDFAGGPVPADLDRPPSIFLRPVGDDRDMRWGLAGNPGMKDDGTFRMDGIVGSHAATVDEPTGWIVSAVVLPDGTNILDRAFAFEPGKDYAGVRVLLSDQVGTIVGTVPAGVPKNAVVVAFPEDEALRKVERLVKRTAVDATGRFTVADLRPGIRYLVTVCGSRCISGYDAVNLDALASRATAVDVDRPTTFGVELKR